MVNPRVGGLRRVRTTVAPFHTCSEWMCNVQSSMGVYGEQPISSAQPRGNGIVVSGTTLILVAHLKMVRFLKKDFWKRSPKPVPEDTQAHQTTNVEAKRDQQAEGELRLGKVVELIRQVGLIWPSHQIPTAQEVLRSQTKTEQPGINGFPPGLPPLRLPGTMVVTQVSAVG